jgi:hypothetical protein
MPICGKRRLALDFSLCRKSYSRDRLFCREKAMPTLRHEGT